MRMSNLDFIPLSRTSASCMNIIDKPIGSVLRCARKHIPWVPRVYLKSSNASPGSSFTQIRTVLVCKQSETPVAKTVSSNSMYFYGISAALAVPDLLRYKIFGSQSNLAPTAAHGFTLRFSHPKSSRSKRISSYSRVAGL